MSTESFVYIVMNRIHLFFDLLGICLRHMMDVDQLRLESTGDLMHI